MRTEETEKLWKGVPLSRDGKVRLRDGRTGEFLTVRLLLDTCII